MLLMPSYILQVVTPLATGSKDKTVQLWNATTGQHITTLTTNMRWWVKCLAYSPDGTTIASGSGWETVHLWDIATRNLKATIEGETDSIYSIAYSPDGKTLATASGYDTVHLWDIASHQLKRTLVGHENDVHAIAYSPDGDTLVSVSLDGTMLLWDTSTSTTTLSLIPTPAQHHDIGQRLTFSINIANGESIAGYQLTVLYDSTALRYIESANGSYLGGPQPVGVFTIPPIVSEKGVTLAATTFAGTSSGNGTLTTVTFEVVVVKESLPTISNVLLTQGKGNSIVPKIESEQKTDSQERVLKQQ